MGLLPWQFYEFSLLEYMCLKQGRRKARRKQLQEDFQHVRIQAYYAILPYLEKKDKKKGIDQLIPDIYEPQKAIKKPSYQDLMERYKKAGAFNGRRSNKY